MGDHYPIVKAAVVQAAPIFLDREACTEKACRLIREAGRSGAKLIAFPEGFIPGHPLWYHFHPATGPTSREMALRLFKNAVEIPGPQTEALCQAAREAGAYVVMGLCEKRPGTFGTLFNSQLFIGADGKILGKHQKLTPTVGEKLVHTGGFGDTLRAFDTEFGRIAGLICGESSNPLSLFTLIAEGTMILVISWPNLPGRKMLNRADRAVMAGRGCAFMSKAYILNSVGSVNDEMKAMLAYTEADKAFLADDRLSGGSSIISPNGEVLAGPLGHEEGILYADLDLERSVEEKLIHDLAGHYNRPDVFCLKVNAEAPSLYRRERWYRQADCPKPLDGEGPCGEGGQEEGQEA
jgi:aliphatic nitrilase